MKAHTFNCSALHDRIEVVQSAYTSLYNICWFNSKMTEPQFKHDFSMSVVEMQTDNIVNKYEV